MAGAHRLVQSLDQPAERILCEDPLQRGRDIVVHRLQHPNARLDIRLDRLRQPQRLRMQRLRQQLAQAKRFLLFEERSGFLMCL